MAHFKDLIVNGAIRLFDKLYVNKGATVSGIVECDKLEVDNLNLGGSNQGIYVSNGVMKASHEYLQDIDDADASTQSNEIFVGTETTSNGNKTIINFSDDRKIYTNPSGDHANGIEFYSYASQSYPTLRHLTNRNWRDMIVVDGNGAEAGDGTVFVNRRNQIIDTFTLNQQYDKTITIPNSVEFKLIDSSYMSSFRTETWGSNRIGDYFSVVRSNTDNVSSAPNYSSGLAWGKGNNNAYFMPSFSADSSKAYIGGGSGNSTSWVKEVAWYENIPNLSTCMKTNGENATAAALRTIVGNGTTDKLTTTPNYNDYTLGLIKRNPSEIANPQLDLIRMDDISNYLSSQLNQNIYAVPHMPINNYGTLSTSDLTFWFNIYTESLNFDYGSAEKDLYQSIVNKTSAINVFVPYALSGRKIRFSKSFIYIDRFLCNNNRYAASSGVIDTSKLPTLTINIIIPIQNMEDYFGVYFDGFESNVTNLFGNGANNIQFSKSAIIFSKEDYTSLVDDGGVVMLALTFHTNWTKSQIQSNQDYSCFNQTNITYDWVHNR